MEPCALGIGYPCVAHSKCLVTNSPRRKNCDAAEVVRYNSGMNIQKPSWKLRRRAVFGSLIFSMIVIAYVAIRWESTSLAETLVLGSFGLIGAIVAAYIGGAAYEDVRLPQYIEENKKINDEHYEETEGY